MADEYTPTTDEVRHAFIGWHGRRAGVSGETAEAAFGRFLAAYEAEVRGRITQEIRDACPTGTDYPWPEAFVAAARIAGGDTR